MVGKRSRKDPSVEIVDSVVVKLNETALDIFTSPKTLSPILSSRELSFSPIGSLDNDGDITFVIPRSPDEWTDFTQFWLNVSIIVETEDGKKIPVLLPTTTSSSTTPISKPSSSDEESTSKSSKDGSTRSEVNHSPDPPDISIPNDIFDCLFRRIMLEVNGTQVGSTHWFHPHVAVLKNMLTYTKELGDSQLHHSIGWIVRNTFTLLYFISASDE